MFNVRYVRYGLKAASFWHSAMFCTMFSAMFYIIFYVMRYMYVMFYVMEDLHLCCILFEFISVAGLSHYNSDISLSSTDCSFSTAGVKMRSKSHRSDSLKQPRGSKAIDRTHSYRER